MNKEINLISNQKQFAAAQVRRLKFVRMVAGISLAIVVVFSVALYFLNKNSPLDSLIAQEKTATADVGFFKAKAGKVLLLENRLTAIRGILSGRSSFETTIQTFLHIMPPGVTIDTLILDKKNISISFASSSLQSLSTILNFVTDNINNKKIFRHATISGIVFDVKTGSYVLAIEAQLL